MKPNWLIWSVSWQPGLRMVENDAKFLDFERLMAAWNPNHRKWYQIRRFGTSLGSLSSEWSKWCQSCRFWASFGNLGQNARKWCKLIIFGSLAQNDRKSRWIGWFENTRNGLIFTISAASADRIMGVSRRRAGELTIYINNTPPPLEPGKVKNRAARSGDPSVNETVLLNNEILLLNVKFFC